MFKKRNRPKTTLISTYNDLRRLTVCSDDWKTFTARRIVHSAHFSHTGIYFAKSIQALGFLRGRQTVALCLFSTRFFCRQFTFVSEHKFHSSSSKPIGGRTERRQVNFSRDISDSDCAGSWDDAERKTIQRFQRFDQARNELSKNKRSQFVALLRGRFFCDVLLSNGGRIFALVILPVDVY